MKVIKSIALAGLVLMSCGKKLTTVKPKENSTLNALASIPLPAQIAKEGTWEFQPKLSDDFNYEFQPTNAFTTFGQNKWKNFYQSKWDGPGVTYWKYNHSYVDGNDLIIKTSRWNQEDGLEPIARKPNKMGLPEIGVNAGCITSTKTVRYPVFIEAKVSVTNLAMASDVWLLSQDATQEIDIIECYGGKEPNNGHFAKSIHVSTHSFVRKPFQDYQPRDKGAWIKREGVDSWGEYCDVNGTRKYVKTGVYWKSPVHFEYYLDGELVRVIHDKSVATKVKGVWEYGYPTMTDGKLDKEWGKQKITISSKNNAYDFKELEKANKISKVSMVDAFEYQGGKGFTKDLNIIINVEAQNWHAKAGRVPSDAHLNDPTKNNNMKVDWFRVFKPKS